MFIKNGNIWTILNQRNILYIAIEATEPSYSNERIGRLSTIPIIIQVRAAAKHTLPLLPLLPFFSFFPCVSEQNGGPKKALNPQIRGTEGV